MKNLLAMCLNWRALALLIAAALAVWLLSPNSVLGLLPVLLLLACPASMLIMAWMMRGQMADRAAPGATAVERLAALDRERARLADEIARARSDTDERSAPPSGERHAARD